MTTHPSTAAPRRKHAAANSELLLTGLAEQLASHVLPDKPIIVRLDSRQKTYRSDVSSWQAAIEFRLLRGHEELAPSQYLGPLPKLLDRCLKGVDGFRQLGRATLPIIACHAWRYLAVLKEQMCGKTIPNSRRPTYGPRNAGQFGSYLRHVLQAAQSSWSVAQKMARAVMERAARLGQDKYRPTMLQLRYTPEGVQAEWLDRNHVARHTESLLEFLRCVSAGLLDDWDLDGYTLADNNIERDAMQQLESTSPLLAAMVSQVLRSGGRVGTLVDSYTARPGVLMSAWAHVEGDWENTGVGKICISAHRAHDEFILQGPQGDKYYFPPCLLAARLAFTGVENPRVYRPLVLQPAGGYRWIHPYSGSLHRDELDPAALTPSRDPAMGTASDQAKRLFPGLATRLPRAQSRDICLAGQEVHVHTIAARFQSSVSPLFRPDMLGLCTDLHEIARAGLTRAHEGNIESTPRTVMTGEGMFYPLRGRSVNGSLAQRIFPYRC
jgi:hypothetical protein